MDDLIRYVQRSGLVLSLLIVGVLMGLMTPLPSEAGTPTLTIDGVPLTVANGLLDQNGVNGLGCANDSEQNGSEKGCYVIVGRNGQAIPDYPLTSEASRVCNTNNQFGRVCVWNYQSSNRARVKINDTTPGTESMKLTGIVVAVAANIEPSPQPNQASTSQPCPNVGSIANTGCVNFFITLQNTFNAGSAPQTAGVFPWSLSVNGQFDPVGSANVINNKFRLAGQACFTTIPCTPPPINTTCDTLTCAGANRLGTIHYSVIQSGGAGTPQYLNTKPAVTQSTGVNIDGNTTTTNDICNMGGNRCSPTALYSYEVQLQGKDALFVTDSVTGCGGPCNPAKATNKLLQCGDENTPGTLIYQCVTQINEGNARDLAEFIALGGVEGQTCEGTCIIIYGDGTPPGDAFNETFQFATSGDGVCCGFDLKLDSEGHGWKVFSNLAPDSDPGFGERFFTIPGPYPTKNNGQLWSTDQIQCTSAEGVTGSTYVVVSAGANNSDKIALRVLTLAPDDRFFCRFHFH